MKKSTYIYSKRGIINKINLWLYVIFHILMLAWTSSFLGDVGDTAASCVGDACMAGAGIGATVGIGMIGFIWMVFGLIGGLIVYMTRPKIIGKEEQE